MKHLRENRGQKFHDGGVNDIFGCDTNGTGLKTKTIDKFELMRGFKIVLCIKTHR
jgi:hypothetical protein